MYKEQDLKGFICARLKELRKEKKYTQHQVAELIYISQNTYSELESGKRKMDIERLLQLCKIFQVPISYFFILAGQTGNKKIKRKSERNGKW